MEKVYTLLWILFGVGVFIFRMVMKMRETSARESQERPPRPRSVAPELPATSFQDMLKQMQARNAEPASTPQPTPAVPQPLPFRTPGGRLLPREIARPTLSQERTKVRQSSLEAPATARSGMLTPLVRRSSELPRASMEVLGQIKPVVAASPSAALNETVRTMLRQPESVRAAFVLSEIFQRKY
ncbi:hypothetical protein ACFQT0_17730 [Hymenobacter humi]|uniref:Uncharacterized protein n=1 Tax=Hymenobacter humi TaxID=1411620 RepID=A0ABW2U7W9_9BACT